METIEKSKYVSPEIKVIILDHEISLILESTPPSGPGELAQSNTSSIFKDSGYV